MHFPRLPDWVVYLVIVVALTVAAIGRQDPRADAPAPPPPVPGAEGMPLGPSSPFDPSVVVRAPDTPGPDTGTAFSVSDSGVWLTARHVVEGCSKAAIVVAEGRGVAAAVHITAGSEAAVLTTQGGSPALPMGLERPLKRGAAGYAPGFPQGRPGEITTRLLGRENLLMRGRGARTEPVLVWAEVGRTDGLNGPLSGISGAPTLDEAGRVIAVTVGEAPRRGRIYTTTPEAVRAALADARIAPSAYAAGQPIALDNYGRVADTLRRDLRVAQVVCLSN
jgi:S1-C subfamily serine protease